MKTIGEFIKEKRGLVLISARFLCRGERSHVKSDPTLCVSVGWHFICHRNVAEIKIKAEKRISEGLSLREASKLSGVSHTHIRDIERGSSVPSFEMVMTFLRAYAIEIGEFLRETGYLPPDLEPEQTAKIKPIPILSWTQAGHWRECDNSQEYDCDMIETTTGRFGDI